MTRAGAVDPDWGCYSVRAPGGHDAEAIATQIDAFNAAAQQACDVRGIAFVDITPVSRARGAEQPMLAEDGLHPSASLYNEWMRLALPVVRAMDAR